MSKLTPKIDRQAIEYYGGPLCGAKGTCRRGTTSLVAKHDGRLYAYTVYACGQARFAGEYKGYKAAEE